VGADGLRQIRRERGHGERVGHAVSPNRWVGPGRLARTGENQGARVSIRAGAWLLLAVQLLLQGDPALAVK
jgi:hypothetical protein